MLSLVLPHARSSFLHTIVSNLLQAAELLSQNRARGQALRGDCPLARLLAFYLESQRPRHSAQPQRCPSLRRPLRNAHGMRSRAV